jgi:hypothetical protein
MLQLFPRLGKLASERRISLRCFVTHVSPLLNPHSEPKCYPLVPLQLGDLPFHGSLKIEVSTVNLERRRFKLGEARLQKVVLSAQFQILADD